MAAEMTKIEKEALKHATEYASYMTTVAKRAYYDGYLKGMKQKNLKIKVDSGKVIKNLKKIKTETDLIPKKVVKKLNANGKKKKCKQDKILAYLEKYEYGCSHDFMGVLKTNNIHRTSSIVGTLIKKGLVQVDGVVPDCKRCKRLHKRYKLCNR